jgi:hypothetical protein
MLTIQQRHQRRATSAFVAVDTVDLLADKLIKMIGERRTTLVRRYLGDAPGRPLIVSGLRLSHQGIGDPVTATTMQSVSVNLVNTWGNHQSVHFGVQRAGETEAQVRDRYDNPAQHTVLHQRKDIIFVELVGWPGSPHQDDRVRIERWNASGVGEETTLAFDDINPVQEIAWEVQGDRERRVELWDEFCDTHRLHYEHPDHQRDAACLHRPATLAENLAVIAHLAHLNEQKGQSA